MRRPVSPTTSALLLQEACHLATSWFLPHDDCSGTRLGIGSAIGALQYIAFIMKKLWKKLRRSARTLCYHYSSTRKTESPFVGGSATAVRPDGEMRISG